MSHNEFLEWIAYARNEPIGSQRGDVQSALIAMLIANANRDTKKQSKPFEIDQFVFDFWKERQAKTSSQLLEKFRYIAAQHNQILAAKQSIEQEHGANH